MPLAIVSLYPESGDPSLQDIPPNLTNPICIGTAALLADEGSTADAFSGTNSSFPIPLEQSQSKSDVQGWCPWDLQLNAPRGPGNGIYSYPDGDIQRPLFQPCYSACAKYNKASDCCTGFYDSPQICKPSTYSRDVKRVCPDAYSYGMFCSRDIWKYPCSSFSPRLLISTAFDDQTSTFIIPSGGGFEVTFCPTGRSSNIIAVYKQQLLQLSQTGHVSSNALADMEGKQKNGARGLGMISYWVGLLGLVMAILGRWV